MKLLERNASGRFTCSQASLKVLSGVNTLRKNREIFTECCNAYVNDKARLLGFSCSIMSMSRRHSLFQIASLKFWISPAIDHKQIAFFFDGTFTPVGFITWAYLARDVEERLLKDPEFLLHPSEWNEGGKTWIIDFAFTRVPVVDAVRNIKHALRAEGVETINWARRNEDYTVRKISSCSL
ncbi:toxin-activating lysine-acyltransferase [Pseudomonas fluorescens]|uniref:toxin-activating lysine-acyltransferase n=1 Tax=Pseudomonas fluorescens TaxID=294 RepID=UPI001240CE16|nr:toxin-activating lysine-acyltransferase [Pseudomonas fluorescens]